MKTSVYQGIDDSIKANAIRRQGQVGLNPGVFEALANGLDNLGKIGAQQGFAAGDTRLGDAKSRSDFCQATEFFRTQEVAALQPVRHLFGQAIHAAKIASIGDRDPQICSRSTEGVQKKRFVHQISQ